MSLSESLLLNKGASHLVSSSHTSVHRITRCRSSFDDHDDDDFRCSCEKEQNESNRLFLPPHKLQQVKFLLWLRLFENGSNVEAQIFLWGTFERALRGDISVPLNSVSRKNWFKLNEFSSSVTPQETGNQQTDWRATRTADLTVRWSRRSKTPTPSDWTERTAGTGKEKIKISALKLWL